MSIAATTVAPVLRVSLRGLVDYAGLFPPASLDMVTAAAEYADHRASADAWILGRFILPAARLEEFESAADAVLPRDAARSWALSALLGSNLEEDIERIERFNARHRDARSGAVMVDTVELKAHSVHDVDHAGELLDRRFDTYMEIPPGDAGSLGELVEAISRTKAKAKIRTGGVTVDAFPSPTSVARFLATCIASDVAFKATAGLHHPWRAVYPLTYAADAPRGVMFGFLNILLAVAVLCEGRDEALAINALEEGGTGSVSLEPDAIRWRGHVLPLSSLERARESLVAFGSCSFREPVGDLRALHLL